MKRILILMMLFPAVAAYSQKVTGTFSPLKEQEKVNFVVDFSHAEIMGMSEEQFAIYEEDWNPGKPEVVTEIRKALIECFMGHPVIGDFPEAEYSLVLDVDSVNKNGNIYGALHLKKNGGDMDDEIVGTLTIPVWTFSGVYGHGARFGTKLYRIKCGGRDLVREYLWPALKKNLKKKK